MKNEPDVEDAWTNKIRSMFERRININAQIDDATGVRVFTCPNSIKRDFHVPARTLEALEQRRGGVMFTEKVSLPVAFHNTFPSADVII